MIFGLVAGVHEHTEIAVSAHLHTVRQHCPHWPSMFRGEMDLEEAVAGDVEAMPPLEEDGEGAVDADGADAGVGDAEADADAEAVAAHVGGGGDVGGGEAAAGAGGAAAAADAGVMVGAGGDGGGGGAALAAAYGALAAVANADHMSMQALAEQRRNLLREKAQIERQQYNRQRRQERLGDRLAGVHDEDLAYVLGLRAAKKAESKAKARPKAKAAGKAGAKAAAKGGAKAKAKATAAGGVGDAVIDGA